MNFIFLYFPLRPIQRLVVIDVAVICDYAIKFFYILGKILSFISSLDFNSKKKKKLGQNYVDDQQLPR